MPRIKIHRITPTHKKKVRIYVLTEDRLYKRAMQVVRQIDAKKAAGAIRTLITSQPRETTPVILVEDGVPNREGIHEMTRGGVCHRPDLWYRRGGNCDDCALFPHCLREHKRLKFKESQPPDENREYFRRKEQEERVYGELVSRHRRPRVVIAQPKKRRIRIKLKTGK